MKENTQTGGWHRQAATRAVAYVAAEAPSEEWELKGKSQNQGGKKKKNENSHFVFCLEPKTVKSWAKAGKQRHYDIQWVTRNIPKGG